MIDHPGKRLVILGGARAVGHGAAVRCRQIFDQVSPIEVLVNRASGGALCDLVAGRFGVCNKVSWWRSRRPA